MQNRSLQFRRTIRVYAAMIGLARRPDHVPAAHRTMLRHLKGLVTPRMLLVLDNLHDLRNHIAAALDLNPIANLYAQFLDEVHVVQRGARYRCASDRDGREPEIGRASCRARAYIS